MRKQFFFFSAFIFAASLNPAVCQKLIPNSAVTGVCYAGSKTKRIYIPPPARYFRKAGREGTASITVLYSGIPDNAKAAVGYAVSILESVLPSGTRLTLGVSWERITTTGVLANSSITGYATGESIDAQYPLVVYPVSLAEKISGKNLNDSLSSDIDLRINNSINWYLGTDGNTPVSQYDLVTVVLHEVCHGLGFFDSMNTSNNIGWYGIGDLPLIYDIFIEDRQEARLTDTLAYANYSNQLYRQLTGGDVYFDGPVLRTALQGGRTRLYAPSTWDSGSSISHLDENSTAEPNTLMTPFIDKGEAIHDPGEITLAILGDLGWINTRILNEPLHDTEAHLTDIKLNVSIASDTSYHHDMVGAVFSYNDFASADTIVMTSPASDNNYTCVITVPSYNTGIQYYFYTEDFFSRIYRSPSLFDSTRYSIYVGTDTVRPVIVHTPLESFLERIDTIKISAVATDNLGVDTVYLEYRLNEGTASFLPMNAGVDNGYEGDLVTSYLFLKGGDSIRYRIFAIDSAANPNLKVLPEEGYFTIHIEGLGTTLTSYSTDFKGDAANDFIDDGLVVARPAGFVNYGLNSPHPYESPEDNDKSIQYSSVLRHPLKFSESGMVFTYNEIVLVEPGESGSLYGSSDFYDYVIVEGSRDFGKTWFSLTDGYDSRFQSTWVSVYNSSIDGLNSTATGKESMLARHSFFFGPSQNIQAGDTLLVRFRLFSDPYANGWGWIVEDLAINPLVDAVQSEKSDPEPVIFPNPGRGLIHLLTSDSGAFNGKPLHYSIINSSGVGIETGLLSAGDETYLDISRFPAGIYFIVLSRDDWIKAYKYVMLE